MPVPAWNQPRSHGVHDVVLWLLALRYLPAEHDEQEPELAMYFLPGPHAQLEAPAGDTVPVGQAVHEVVRW